MNRESQVWTTIQRNVYVTVEILSSLTQSLVDTVWAIMISVDPQPPSLT